MNEMTTIAIPPVNALRSLDQIMSDITKVDKDLELAKRKRETLVAELKALSTAALQAAEAVS